MNKALRFKLLTKFTSLIRSSGELMSRRGISAKKGFLPFLTIGFFLLLLLNPFFSYAQFPYDETFRNATTNKPDVVFGGDLKAYLTAGKAPNGSAALDPVGQGYLRLTNTDGDQKGYVYSNNVFLGTYGLNIEFEYYTYGGTGADGICFFLFDATVPAFNIGAFGGSLGYSQKGYTENRVKIKLPGVTKGYLGIGLDEYGNFANALEDRSGGLTPPSGSSSSLFPDYVVIRGAGDGYSTSTNNYGYITSRPSPFAIAGGKRGAVAGENEYRKVFISLKPIKPGTGLTISVSIQKGGVVTPIIVDYPYPVAVPAGGLKYGIASSTGGSNNYHEIRGLSLSVDKSVLDEPKAPSPSMNICQGDQGILDILAGATKPNAGGEPNPDNVDLNPSTPAIEQKVTTSAGTFEFDLANTKKLIFTPAPGFTGSSASITFTFMDVYGAKSSIGTATFNIGSPIIVTQPKSGTICENSAFTTTVTATGSNLTYQWESYNSGSGWANLPDPDGSLGAKTNTLNISMVPFAYNGSQYRVHVISPGGCNVTSDVITLTVNQLPKAEISPLSQNVCEGSSVVPVTFKGLNGTGPYTFSYTLSDGTVTSAIQTITTAGSGNSAIINHPTNVPGVFTYKIVNVSNSTCSNIQLVKSVITVTPNSSIGVTPVSGTAVQSVCVDVPIKPIVYQVKDADMATVSFNKPNPGLIGVYDADKNQITISGTSAIVGKFPFTVTTLGGCSTASSAGEINILPNTTVALSSAINTDAQVLCVNQVPNVGVNLNGFFYTGTIIGTQSERSNFL
ncbi:hypothetical protein TH53_26310 [Pedobacter lusitanus]|uniref:Ig-like domain-containing protein n=1 Tax=Pedobacter lusitanus TaxID=1503925 RepID=A0A0D0GE72_9SPHI|nr:hypothetical protein [Pedobacter lusitanus]KIO74465.1 hypothetical protein TH53_26310 [Pedobacter lusitanus]